MEVNMVNPADEREQADDVHKVAEEIRQRGERLLDEFEALRLQDLDALMPDLVAIRIQQDKVIQALEEIKNREDETG